MRLLWISLLGVILAASLSASGVNIKLSGNQDPTCGPGTPFVCVTGDTFQISTNNSGGGFFDGVNGRSSNITQLDFNLAYVDAGCPGGSPTPVQVSFDPSFFSFTTQSFSETSNSTCTSQSGVADFTLALNFLNGIPVGDEFQISLNTDGSSSSNAAGGWVPNETFTVSTVPEPRSTLAVAGALALLLFTVARRRARAQ